MVWRHGAFPPSVMARRLIRDQRFPNEYEMPSRLHRATLLVVYQFVVTIGILFMPLALVARRAGVPVPFGRVLARLDAALESTAE